jgi:hypothetical protein
VGDQWPWRAGWPTARGHATIVGRGEASMGLDMSGFSIFTIALALLVILTLLAGVKTV